MIQQTLSNTMSVTDLVPKAATRLPEGKSSGAFSEALAGAHTVHDQRDAQATTRDRGQVARSHDRPRVGDDDRGAREARDTERVDGPQLEGSDAARPGEGAEKTERADSGERPAATGAEQADAGPEASHADAAAIEAGAQAQAATSTDGTEHAAAAAAAAAGAAATASSDADAVLTPVTAATPQVTTNAVDAAMRLAIDADATTAVVDETATTTTPVGTVAVDADAELETAAATTVGATAANTAGATTAATARGAEDVETGDATAGAKAPTASMPIQQSGPSPAQLAAATFNTADAAAQAAAEAEPTAQLVQQVATAQVAEVATGSEADAGAAQLVQTTVVASDGETATDADATVTTTAATAATATKAADADAGTKLAADVQVVDAEAPEVAQVARNVQGQAPTVAANAQFQAQVQAKAAEQAAEEAAGEAAAPVKVEGTVATQSQPLTTTQTEAAPGGVRVREGFLASNVQARIDHIAEQLATRLRLSQAAGGNQVQLSLKPRELGEVTVQMQVREGVVAATVLVDRPETLHSLERNLEDLKRSLEQQGLSIQEFSVDVRGEAGAGGANARAAAELNQQSARARSGSNASVAGAATAIPGLSGDREVDPDSLHDGEVSVLA